MAERIEVDIGAAFKMLQESPELCDAMTEMVGGPALAAAQAEVERLRAGIIKIRDYLDEKEPRIGDASFACAALLAE